MPVPTAPGDKRPLAIASLILGILSLCGSAVWFCGGLFSVVGIILGVLGLNSKGRGMAIAGIILAGVGLLMTIVFRLVLPNVFNSIWQQIMQSTGV
jgi:hypothetical protein